MHDICIDVIVKEITLVKEEARCNHKHDAMPDIRHTEGLPLLCFYEKLEIS